MLKVQTRPRAILSLFAAVHQAAEHAPAFGTAGALYVRPRLARGGAISARGERRAYTPGITKGKETEVKMATWLREHRKERRRPAGLIVGKPDEPAFASAFERQAIRRVDGVVK